MVYLVSMATKYFTRIGAVVSCCARTELKAIAKREIVIPNALRLSGRVPAKSNERENEQMLDFVSIEIRRFIIVQTPTPQST
jgi:hypothetical protein